MFSPSFAPFHRLIARNHPRRGLAGPRRSAALESLESRQLLCAALHGEVAAPSDAGAAEAVVATRTPAVETIRILVDTDFMPLLLEGETVEVTGKPVGTALVGDCAPPGEYDVSPAAAVDRPGADPVEIISLAEKKLKKGTVLLIGTLVQSCNDFEYIFYLAEVVDRHPSNSSNSTNGTGGEAIAYAAPAKSPLFGSNMFNDDERLVLEDMATASQQ